MTLIPSKQELTPEVAQTNIDLLNSLLRHGGWTIISDSLEQIREELINQLKIQSDEQVRAKLIAVDLLRTLPSDMIKEIQLSVAKPVEEQFGNVET